MKTLGINDLTVATEYYQQGLGFPKEVIDSACISFFELARTSGINLSG